MIKTMIEVTGETEWEHAKQLDATLAKLGFEPRASKEAESWRRDLFDALIGRGLTPNDLVDEIRKIRLSATE